MKMLSKTIAVAAMAIAATGVAEARILTIGDATANGSELVLNLVNFTAQNSFTLDLGITIEQFLANPSQTISRVLSGAGTTLSNGSFGDDTGIDNFTNFTNALQPGHNVTWGVSGGHGILNELTDLPKFGFYTTSVDALPAPIDPDAAQISNTASVWNDMVGSFNTAQDAISDNNSSFRTVGQGGYTAKFGNNFLNALPFDAQAPLGSELFFVREKVNSDDFDTGELVTFAGKWNLNIASGTVTYAAVPAAVPLPAAVWMFGAGLMGMLRLNRRKSMAA